MGTRILIPLAVAVFSATAFAHHESTFEHIPLQERIKMSERTESWAYTPPIVSIADNGVPSDAMQLMASDLSQWESTQGGDAPWIFANGEVTVAPGSGDIRSKRAFCDIQLHFEWRAPTPSAGMVGQQRNNSGIFLQERYELQILDSFDNPTYGNGQAGAIYKQVPPRVNAMKAPGEWQRYDILYTAPRFDGEARVSPGYVTLIHNGVVLHNHQEIAGTTEWIGPPQIDQHGCAPLKLQDHGNKVSFRNMWVREL
ncbi:MAG TPA: DUF1080 domain-containing protein [Pseudomonadales bacterium]|nr:DUF1080 domain-containing protein [Pseudomonadales bacterium]